MQHRVTHLTRAFLHPSTSFVRNQIVHCIKYLPSVVYTDKIESDFFREITSRFPAYKAPHGTIGKFVCSRLLHFTPSDERKLIRWISETGTEVFHVHFGVEAILYSGIIRKLNIPAVVSFYGHDCTSFPARYGGLGLTMLKRKVFFNPGVRLITAMSPDMYADLVALGCPEEKLRVYYFGTETSQFSMDRDYRDKDLVCFLVISHLEEKKGHRFLIDAFNRASSMSERKIQLKIIGNGALKGDILEQVALSGATNILMQDFVKYKSGEHLESFKNADVFVHPSITAQNGNKEGIPGSIIEAMSSGLPVITTFHGGIPYVISNGETGLLVEENAVDQLAAAIVRLADNADLRRRLGTAAKSYAQTALDIHHKQMEIEQIYDEISGGQS